MGLMDKAKEAALQAKASAQQMAQQGQAKVATMQQTRNEGELYRTLGEAYYNEQRRGGNHEAVVAALRTLDEHFASAAANPGPAGGPTTSPPPAGSGPAAPPPAGGFKLDDM
jgi:hypothetical protein